MLSLLRAWVQSLVGELTSRKQCGVAKKRERDRERLACAKPMAMAGGNRTLKGMKEGCCGWNKLPKWELRLERQAGSGRASYTGPDKDYVLYPKRDRKGAERGWGMVTSILAVKNELEAGRKMRSGD